MSKKLHGKKVLIFENHPCHHECIPIWVKLFQDMGATVFVSYKNISPNFNIVSMLKKWFPSVKIQLKYNLDQYDFVVNNTLYSHNPIGYLPKMPVFPDKKVKTDRKLLPHPDPNVRKGNKSSKPKELDRSKLRRIKPNRVYSVLHKFGPFRNPEAINHKKHWIISLAPHVHEKVQKLTSRSVCLLPIYFGPIRPQKFPVYDPTKVRFVIQGSVEFIRRNYKSMFDVISQCINKGKRNFEVLFIGKANGHNLRKIKQLVNKELRQNVKLIFNCNYEQFIKHVRNQNWILPLVDSTFKHTYFTLKLTSSISMGVGNAIPLILHKQLADIYSLTNEDCISYTDQSSFQVAFEKALDMTPEQYQTYKQKSYQTHLDWMKRNAENLEKAI